MTFKDQLRNAEAYLASVSEPAQKYRFSDPDLAAAIQFEAETWTIRYVRGQFPKVADRIIKLLNI